MVRWIPRDDEYLQDHYPYTDNITLAATLRRTERSVAQRATVLGLRKSKEHIVMVNSQSASGVSKTFRCNLCHVPTTQNQKHCVEIDGERIETEHCKKCALDRRLNFLVNNWPIITRGELVSWAMSGN